MIRRDWHSSDGRDGWVLISQIDHARLAGRMADDWSAALMDPPEANEELLWTIAHHDDGWASWERSPGLDPHHGRPRDFTEMPQNDALAIWDDSITVAADYSPLAGWLVSGHFCSLLHRFAHWEKMDAAEVAAARQFLENEAQRQAEWLITWQRLNSAAHSEAAAHLGLQWLQFFDALSLWFCCARRDSPHQVTSPAGQSLTFTPQSTSGDRDEDQLDYEVALGPWPLRQRHIAFQVSGLAVSLANYTAWDAVAAAGRRVSLKWVLTADRQAENA